MGDHHLAQTAFNDRWAGMFAREAAAGVAGWRCLIGDYIGTALERGQADIAQAHPLHGFGQCDFFDDQGDQGGPQRDDGVAKRCGHGVAVAGGARFRPGGAAGGQDNDIGGEKFPFLASAFLRRMGRICR